MLGSHTPEPLVWIELTHCVETRMKCRQDSNCISPIVILNKTAFVVDLLGIVNIRGFKVLDTATQCFSGLSADYRWAHAQLTEGICRVHIALLLAYVISRPQ